jgi:uncharacterized sulfatase
VPLVVRVPNKWKQLVGRDFASRSNGFVEFVDFGPTVLQLAGVDLPQGIDGEPFLGKGIDPAQVDARDEALGYADRFDEKYDLVRSLRIGKYKYIRNFEPFLPDALQNNYRYIMLAYQQWRQLHAAGELNEFQSQFFEPKEVEGLYDLERDPHEIHNLASSPEHLETLKRMRARLSERLKAMPDLSFVPEAVLYDEAMANPVEFGQANKKAIAESIDTVNLALQPFSQAKAGLEAAITSDDPWTRYWGLVACSSFGDQASALVPLAKKRLVDLEPLVVVRAVEFLSIVTEIDSRWALYRSIQRATNEPEALRMLNTAAFLNDFTGGRLKIDTDKIEFLFQPKKGSELLRRTQYLSRD